MDPVDPPLALCSVNCIISVKNVVSVDHFFLNSDYYYHLLVPHGNLVIHANKACIIRGGKAISNLYTVNVQIP